MTTDSDSLRITDWAMEDRPREKLMAQGAAALSNAELLAILIGSGTPKMTAVELMKLVLHDCNDNLNTLGKMSIADLMRYKGVGEAKAVTILAACELGKRRQRERQRSVQTSARHRPSTNICTHACKTSMWRRRGCCS